MLLNASVKSKMMKRGSDKKVAELLSKASGKEISNDIRDMVGRLELNAQRSSDFFLLRSIFSVLRGVKSGGGGRLIIYAKDGMKAEDYLSPVTKTCTCKNKKAHLPICTVTWKRDNPKAAKQRQKKAKTEETSQP